MEVAFLPRLIELSNLLEQEIYVVGGFTRNYLINKTISKDVDICSPVQAEIVKSAVLKLNGVIKAEYKRTGTIKFSLEDFDFEYTSFRTDLYLKGEHKPYKTIFTDSIIQDAKRRDFRCNAVYYGVKSGKFYDPLGGIKDIKRKILNTVKAPKKVFCFDGLRLMRLARFAGELGFKPTKRVVCAAKKYSYNLQDVSKERIREELEKILVADQKHSFSPKNGHYVALSILRKANLLKEFLPELNLGNKMGQRRDYHKYSVLEHTFKTVEYAPKEIRLFALLHDVGKPYCKINNGKFSNHDGQGARFTREILKRLKFPTKTILTAEKVVKNHMFNVKTNRTEKEKRLFLVENKDILQYLLPLINADYLAGKPKEKVSKNYLELKGLLEKMQREGTPFSVKELNVSAIDLLEIGILEKDLAKMLKILLNCVVDNSIINERQSLVKKAKEIYINIDYAN